MFEKILLAADGSKHSLKAAQYAKEFVQRYNTTVEIAYVVNGTDAKADVIHHNDPFEIEKARENRIDLVREQFQDAGFETALHILYGEPGSTLLEFIKEHGFDCVILGSRGLSRLQTFLLGSVSHKVAREAPCSVLVVK